MSRKTRIYILLTLPILLGCNNKGSSIYKVLPLEIIVKSESIVITCLHGTTEQMDNINKIELEDSIPKILLRVGGISIPGKVWYGKYLLEDLGKGRLYLQSKEGPFIKIELLNGSFIYINFHNKASTIELFDLILKQRESIILNP